VKAEKDHSKGVRRVGKIETHNLQGAEVGEVELGETGGGAPEGRALKGRQGWQVAREGASVLSQAMVYNERPGKPPLTRRAPADESAFAGHRL
jgi:hypothetical protein